jgi:plastocyanin
VEASFSPATPRFARRPLSGLGKITAGALAGMAILVGSLQALFGGLDPMMTGIAVLFLVIAGVVLIGWRWAPLLGTLLFGLLIALLVVMNGEIAFVLAHPGEVIFSFFAVAIPILVVGFVASISAAVQNYRSRPQGTQPNMPRAVPVALLLIAGLAVGAATVGAIPQAGGSAVSPEALAALPAVTLDKFDGGEIRVKAGETVALRLENPDGAAHTFTIDELGVSSLMPAGKSSLALFKAAQPGAYTFYCIPHYNKATGEGMHGTLIVE